jgi:hypothetical protein
MSSERSSDKSQRLKTHKAEVGQRYIDDSGWQRRVMLDMQAGRLEIELGGSDFSANASELDWLIEALQRVREVVNGT